MAVFVLKNLSIFDEFLVTFFFFKIGQIYMKDAKCADTSEKSIFRFLDMIIFVLKIVNFR